MSVSLQRCYPGNRGLSLRSLERFCGTKHKVSRTSRLDDNTLDQVVSDAVSMVSENVWSSVEARA